MKTLRLSLTLLLAGALLASCSVFKPKYGCGTDGKNVGAEKIASGDQVPKAKKFKS